MDLMNTAAGWLTRDISEVGSSIHSCVVSVEMGMECYR